MIKGFRQIALLTTISRIFGLIRDMTFARFLGAGGFMDLWIIAFQIPNLSRRLFGEGAASASFIPVYREQLDKDPKQATKLACTVVTVIFILLALTVLAGWIALWFYSAFFAKNSETKMMLSLVSIMLPYMIMICTVAILAGILNVHKHFATPATAPIILNIFIISAVLVTAWILKVPTKYQVFFMAIAVLVAGLVQIAIQIPPLCASGVFIRPAWDVHSVAFKKIAILMAPMIIGLAATQLNTLADTWIAKFFSGSEAKGDFFSLMGMQIKYPLWDGAVSYLYYSQRLYQFPLGVLGISLATAVFPVMSANAAKKDYNLFCGTIGKGIKGAVFVAVPATVGLFLVAKPLVAVLFQHGKFEIEDTLRVAWTLCFYAVGLCGFFCQQIVTRAFYSLQESKLPARTALVAVSVNIVLNLILIWFMGTAGLALSTAICSYLQVAILLFMLRKRFGRQILNGFGDNLIKTAIATVIMAGGGTLALYFCRNFPVSKLFDIFRLILVVPISAGLYFIASKLLRIEMLSLLTGKRPK
ncbi:MAG: murein biosynthesis integral membrane protein MurJ [Planctomycetota bacterium]|jgi:putative peptidoglycan lipid II flippase